MLAKEEHNDNEASFRDNLVTKVYYPA